MDYAEFQIRYEQAGDAELKAYLRRPAADLLEDARAGRFGEQYQLWPAIAKRAALADAGPVLLAVLRGDADYLVRYHAAAALLCLMGNTTMTPVQLSAAGRGARIDAIEASLGGQPRPG